MTENQELRLEVLRLSVELHCRCNMREGLTAERDHYRVAATQLRAQLAETQGRSIERATIAQRAIAAARAERDAALALCGEGGARQLREILQLRDQLVAALTHYPGADNE